MVFTPASVGSVAAFVGIVLLVVVALLTGLHRAYGSARAPGVAVMVLALWLGLLGTLIATGTMERLPLHGLPVFFGSVLVVAIGTGLSPVGARLATLPLAALVGFQAFRLPLELVLHSWVAQGTIPATMTWTGQNWDILSGALALVAAPLAGRFPLAARLANVFGLALLLDVMRVALLSAPVPFGWPVQPPLQVAFHLPYALIGPVCVGGALLGHVVLTRALWRRTTADGR